MPEIVLVAFIMALGFGAYWSLVLFPRQRDFKKRQEMARSLAEGDEVITAGGIIGRVHKIDADQGIAFVEIAPNTQVRILTAALLERYDPQEIAQNARVGRAQEEADPNAPIH